jgi:outer membrane receptor for ferrienterochelin and colicin
MRNIVILVWLFPSFILAQKFTISGTITDGMSGENLIGASAFDPNRSTGTTSNTYGFYSLTLPRDSVQLTVSYVGYQTVTVRFFLSRDTTINFPLTQSATLQEIVIDAKAEEQIQNTTRMGTIDVPVEQIKAMPALLGETDVLKVLQLLPGVQSGTEGSSGLYVRGGGPDQNLILLDGVPVYNASHLFGFFSVFNADAINHVELIKGGFPARYGGRLSSVIDISMKEGNQKKIQGEGSIGLIASKLTVEGPLVKDKTSFLISGRRTYIDLLTRPLIQAVSDGDEIAGYYFYDLNAKINHKFDNKNRLYLSTYMGDDKAYARYKSDYYRDNTHVSYNDEFGLNWGNITSALRWNRIISNKLFANLTATYSRYRFKVFGESREKIEDVDKTTVTYHDNQYISGIRDYAIKLDFDFLPAPNHFIRFGGLVTEHLFTPGVFSYKSNQEADTTFGSRKIHATEFFAYVEDDMQLSSRMKVNVGIHASAFRVGDQVYYSAQPRVAARYLLNQAVSLKASYAQMTQYIHLLTNAGLGLPTDLWVPSTPDVKPENSFQYSAGIAYSVNPHYELSIEAYYKKMRGLIEYKEGASYLDLEQDWQTKIESGEGESYGTELFLQKKRGKFNGWAGYTLSWANRTFPNINFGRTFPYKYDRRHDVELALAYAINDKKDIAFTWVYGTGTSITLPNDIYRGSFNGYSSPSGEIMYYEGRNNYRMRSYHRMDLSYTIKKETKWGERAWTFSIYNVYSRRNPFFMDVGYDKQGNKKFIQYTLFPIIPSASVHFKF